MTHDDELIKSYIADGEKLFAKALERRAPLFSEVDVNPCQDRDALVNALGIALATIEVVRGTHYCEECMQTRRILHLANDEIRRILKEEQPKT